MDYDRQKAENLVFTNAYPDSEHRVVTPENYQSFIS